MAEKDPTAEQQLLKLIEGQDDPKASSGSRKRGGSVAVRKAPIFSVDTLRGKVSFTKDSVKYFFVNFKNRDMESNLKIVNTLLAIAISGVFVFLAIEMMVKPQKFKDLPELISVSRKAKDQPVRIQKLRELTFYVNGIKERSLFQPKPEEVKVEEEIVRKAPIDEKTENMKLVGISPDYAGGESYAMIEDTKSETTFFLKEGETISGLTVRKIRDDKIILTDGTEEVELR